MENLFSCTSTFDLHWCSSGASHELTRIKFVVGMIVHTQKVIPINVLLLPGQCITTSGDQPNRPCIFPWKYSKTGSVVYYGCSGPGGYSPWCPTELTDGTYISGSGKWGYCDMAVSACQEGTYLQGLTKRLVRGCENLPPALA